MTSLSADEPAGSDARAAADEPADVAAAGGAAADGAAGGPAADSVVAKAWADLLGAAPTELSDDFFAAGGDSLKAVRFVAAIRDHIGVALPFRVVFDNSTYGELTEIVAKTSAGQSGVSV